MVQLSPTGVYTGVMCDPRSLAGADAGLLDWLVKSLAFNSANVGEEVAEILELAFSLSFLSVSSVFCKNGRNSLMPENKCNYYGIITNNSGMNMYRHSQVPNMDGQCNII